MIAVFAGTGAIGVSIGIVGIGGVFLIPLLVWFGIPLETAIGTSLVTFTATAIVATIVYAWHGAIDWRAALITSAGSVVSGIAGAKISVMLPPAIVTACFAFFLFITGVSALRKPAGGEASGRRQFDAVTLLGCGIVAGIGSGLTGVGGPAVLVPVMLMLRAAPATAIAISQPNSIFSAASGAVGHIVFGHVDFRLAAALAIYCCAGVIAGSILHQRIGAERLRKFVGVSVLLLAFYLVVKLAASGEGL
ncbi:MAG: sulfite exporter TauE/SafE family protein [Vulcanimicrobiaceae bacterium]